MDTPSSEDERSSSSASIHHPDEEELRERMKTRGLQASTIEEDLEYFKQAAKDGPKTLKKAHAKLKAEYENKDDNEEEEDDVFRNMYPDFEPECKKSRPRRGRGRGRKTLENMTTEEIVAHRLRRAKSKKWVGLLF